MLMSLSDLPVGVSAEFAGFGSEMRGCKKFADIGFVRGTVLSVQSHAPLGSLLRVKLLGRSLALHKLDGKNILVKLTGF